MLASGSHVESNFERSQPVDEWFEPTFTVRIDGNNGLSEAGNFVSVRNDGFLDIRCTPSRNVSNDEA